MVSASPSPVLTWAYSAETAFFILSNPTGHFPWPPDTWSLLPFLASFAGSHHPLVPGASDLNPVSFSGFARWSHPVLTPKFMSPAQISPLNSRFRYPAAFLTPLLILVIKRYPNLKCPKPSSGSPHLPCKLSHLTKWQPSSSSWGRPLAHISHSFQQQILLNLLLKSSHPPITTWSKSLPFLTWILPLGFQTHCSHPCPLSVYSQYNSPNDPFKVKARSCCSAPFNSEENSES